MGGKTPSTAAAKQLSQLSALMFKESNPARREMFSQLNEALKTGGIGARIPIIQRAVEDVNRSTAGAVRGTQEQLSRAGVTGPFAAQILAQERMAGSQAAAKIPTDYAQQLIAGGPGLISSGSGIPGLSTAASLLTGASAAGQQATGQLYGGLGSAAGSILGNVNYGGGKLTYGSPSG